jgi:hypothetical protein
MALFKRNFSELCLLDLLDWALAAKQCLAQALEAFDAKKGQRLRGMRRRFWF